MYFGFDSRIRLKQGYYSQGISGRKRPFSYWSANVSGSQEISKNVDSLGKILVYCLRNICLNYNLKEILNYGSVVEFIYFKANFID